jgi:DnaJ family protein C protein 13
LCIEASGVVTLDPDTLADTNSYDFSADFDRAAPDSNASEFTLSVRTDGKGKFKAMCFSSPLHAGILTELHRLRRRDLAPPIKATAGSRRCRHVLFFLLPNLPGYFLRPT